MKTVVVILVILSVSYYSYSLLISNVTMVCHSPTQCLPVSSCGSMGEDEILYPCQMKNKTDTQFVCCEPINRTKLDSAPNVVKTTAETLFPENCGLSVGNRVSGGENATIGENPWMALLGYSTTYINLKQYLCGGTLINHRWILTAAHCLQLPGLTLSSVRLGELNIETQLDCTSDNETCADPILEVDVEKIIQHPKFDTTLKFDIGLIKLSQDVQYTDFIRAVCLPFNFEFNKESFVNKHFKIAGWGLTNDDSIMQSKILQFADVVGMDTKLCNQRVPPHLRPILKSQFCAEGLTGQDSCKGDSGGPLTNVTRSSTSQRRNYQIGIVSLGVGPCGNTEVPSVYTRIDQFLDWIEEIVENN